MTETGLRKENYVLFLNFLVLSIVTKMSALSGIEAIHIATVLEDCVDQLVVLGKIMPTTFEKRLDAKSVSIFVLFLFIH